MKKKIIGLIICIILFSVIVPASGIAINIDEKNKIFRNYSYQDYPGCMPTSYPEFKTQKIPQLEFAHNEIFSPTFDINITDLIRQINESMILGYLENLTDFGPRVTGTSECYEAGEYIYSEFEDMNLEVRFHNWSYGGYSDRNVEATLFGRNSSNNEIYLICAHYDSVPDSPGTDDDGSGVATVMVVAKILQQYGCDHTVRFVTFSGEEQGLLGSHEYANEAYTNGDNIIAVLNADMIGYAETWSGGNKITIRQNEASIWLTDFISNVSQLYRDYIQLDIIPEFDPYGYSDHFSFWQFGYDAIQYREYETNPFYHTSGDTIENMNITYAIKVCKLALATLAELLGFTGPPNLYCEGILIWENVTSGSVLQGNFEVENIGNEGTLLDWNIVTKPSWGEWTFDPVSGNDLEPGIQLKVNVTVIAPSEKNTNYTGKIKIQNKHDAEDYCTIEVKLSTPKNKPFNFKYNQKNRSFYARVNLLNLNSQFNCMAEPIR